MKRHLDLFGNEVPRWVQQLAPKSCSHTLHCLSQAQALHAGLPLKSKQYLSFVHFSPPMDWCPACWTQCRRHMDVHDVYGEPVDITLNAPHLSTAGLPLTSDPESIHRLYSIGTYSLPFWITASECVAFSKHLPSLIDMSVAEEKFRSRVAVARIRCSASVKERDVLNIEEVLALPTNFTLSSALSLFRRFEPLNILNRGPLLPSIATLIRCESWKTRSWCSIWGTDEEFLEAGIQPLEGAISLKVFDSDGEELEITNALRTVNSAHAYRLCFPHCHLTFSC